MGDLVELEGNPFRVEFEFGSTSFVVGHPESLTRGQADRLILAVMRTIQREGHDPWEVIAMVTREHRDDPPMAHINTARTFLLRAAEGSQSPFHWALYGAVNDYMEEK